jgi:cell pole-organizing protein PopZ
MTDQSAQEPTMEEILASIRRIISEDEAPAETPAAAAPATPDAQPEAATAPIAAETIFAAPVEPTPEPAAVEDDVLELTDRYEAPTQSIGDLDVAPKAPEPYQPEPQPAPAWAPESSAPAYDTLVGDSAAASAASAFAGLAASFKKPEPAQTGAGDLPFVSGNTVEAMVAEMLRPLLKDWLDNNLPGIVQAAVQKEVERIARSA